MILLIADSGSTKTDWAIVSDNSSIFVTTNGINPVHQDDTTINSTLLSLLDQIDNTQPTHIYFYGAGCIGGEANHRLETLLAKQFPNASIEVESDLLGAARSLCNRQAGIAGILGTGANSCYYDGKKIIANTPPLGYILGDEGSGASIGKAFLRRLLRHELGDELLHDFYQQYNIDYTTLITRIYRKPAANRFLASLSPYIAQHLHIENVRQTVAQTMAAFFDNHIAPYNNTHCLVNLTGSVAFHYRDIISQVASEKGYKIGNITRSPINNLITFHSQN